MTAPEAQSPSTPGSESSGAALTDSNDRQATDATTPLDPMPVRPPEPDAADCCGEGCIRCVFDRYDEVLERYQTALAAWRDRQP